MKSLSFIVQALSAAIIDPAYGRPLIDCRSDTKVKRLAFSYKPILYVVEWMLSKCLLTAAEVWSLYLQACMWYVGFIC